MSDAADKWPEQDRALGEAIDRLIDNAVRRPTIVEVAQTAGLQRWHLTHRHIERRKDFQARADAKWGSATSDEPTPEGKRLLKLEEKYQRLRERNEELETLLDLYAVAVNEVTMQRDELQAALNNAAPAGVTRLRPRP